LAEKERREREEETDGKGKRWKEGKKKGGISIADIYTQTHTLTCIYYIYFAYSRQRKNRLGFIENC
jgi:hypothetical protein